MRDIKCMTLAELQEAFAALGEPKFRAKQVFKWLHRGVKSFDEMTDLSKPLREKLAAEFHITQLSVARRQVSQIDGTIKYLWQLEDGNCIESVLMGYRHGNTICVSSQVGCRQGCAFCASTRAGKTRDLKSSEILDQILFTEIDSGRKISNIVMMGIGEPLDNFDNVIRFLELVNHPDGINIGMRHITLSTCGIAEGIDKLAEYNLQLTLAVSLHAPDDETRSKIMPVNLRYNVDRLFKAVENYYQKTGRRISFEYSMIDGVNDTPYHAQLLVDRLKGTGSHVNLIRLNNVEESPLRPSTKENLQKFRSHLEENGITATVRRKLGSDIDASCGQLRMKAGRDRRGE